MVVRSSMSVIRRSTKIRRRSRSSEFLGAATPRVTPEEPTVAWKRRGSRGFRQTQAACGITVRRRAGVFRRLVSRGFQQPIPHAWLRD